MRTGRERKLKREIRRLKSYREIQPSKIKFTHDPKPIGNTEDRVDAQKPDPIILSAAKTLSDAERALKVKAVDDRVKLRLKQMQAEQPSLAELRAAGYPIKQD